MYHHTVPSSITKKELAKLTQKFAGKEYHQISLLWVPYQTLECTIQTFEGTIENTKTALNIMFPDEIFDEKSIILLFRPNLLKMKKEKYELIKLEEPLKYLPERKAEICEVNYKRISKKIMSLSKSVYENLRNLESMVIKYPNISNTILRLWLPSADEFDRLFVKGSRNVKNNIEKEFANAMALSTVIKMTLNVKKFPEELEFREKEIFYHPYLIISTEKAFIFVDLVKRGMLSKRFTEDPILNKLVKENKRANEIVRRALSQEDFNTYV
nr:hypothetical protein [Candidatus Baldrarchaeota archaeon]